MCYGSWFGDTCLSIRCGDVDRGIWRVMNVLAHEVEIEIDSSDSGC